MKLHVKFILLFATFMIVTITTLALFTFSHVDQVLRKNLSESTLDMAKTLASLEQIQEGLAFSEEAESVQAFIEGFRKETQYHYIIVMDMAGIQYAYPYPSGLFKPYKNGGETRVLTQGEAYVNYDYNVLISAIQGFAPVFYEGEQVGAILVGLLTDQIQATHAKSRTQFEKIIALAIIFSVVIAILLAMNIKRAIYGLEPKEIALLLSERDLVLKSIHRGVLAVDKDGLILFCNDAAQKQLDLPHQMIGVSLEAHHPRLYQQLTLFMSEKKEMMNQEWSIDYKTKVLMSMNFMRSPSEHVVGAVVHMENYLEVMALAEDLTNYKEINDGLRAQSHEFMNKLHTVSGLIQIEAYEEAIDYIDNLTKDSQKIAFLIKDMIKNNRVAGLLLSKYNRLSEAKVSFTIHDDAHVTALPGELTADAVCSIIGNLLENSYEAVKQQAVKRIDLWIQSDTKGFELEVYNNGPLINEVDTDRIFQKGYTTKQGDGGMGLYIINSIVEAHGGTITYENDRGVTWRVKI